MENNLCSNQLEIVLDRRINCPKSVAVQHVCTYNQANLHAPVFRVSIGRIAVITGHYTVTSSGIMSGKWLHEVMPCDGNARQLHSIAPLSLAPKRALVL